MTDSDSIEAALLRAEPEVQHFAAALRQETLALQKKIAKLQVKIITLEHELQLVNQKLATHGRMTESTTEELEAFEEFFEQRQRAKNA